MKSRKPITIILADDHPIVRQGLALLLGSEMNLKVVGEAEDGLSAVALTEKIRPDILVVDLHMPGLIGSEVVRQVRMRAPQTRAIIFSMHATDAIIVEAFRLGAWGYVPKGADTTDLVEAIHAVCAGRHYLCKSIPGGLHTKIISLFEERDAATNEPIDPYETLTTREREVFQQLAEGRSNKETGERLFISPRTVEIHRANTLRKLGLRTSSDLIRYALSRGLVPPV